MRVGGDDGQLRPWHYIYVYSIERRLIMRDRNPNLAGVRYREADSPLPAEEALTLQG